MSYSSSSSSSSSVVSGGSSVGCARAWIAIVDTDYSSFQPGPMPRELAELVTYGCGQVEGSKDEGYKFRGYFEFSSQSRIGAVREWLMAKPEAAPSGGSASDDEAVADPDLIWAKKFESRPVYLKDRKGHIARHTDATVRAVPEGELIARAPWSHGLETRGSQGERTDMDAIRELLREHGPQEGMRLVAEQFTGQFIRYPSGITQLADMMVPKVPESPDFKLRPWQTCLVKILSGPADDRHIYWIEDGVGGQGKSRLSTYLCRAMNAIELDGKMADCAFAYASQPIVIFDLARPMDVSLLKDLYVMAEKLKNGQLVSSKYQSKMKVFKVPHVVFFSNHAPPMGVWSADRLQHIVLSPAPPFSAHSVAGAAAPPPPPSGADLFKRLLEEQEAADADAAERAAEDAERAAKKAAKKKRQREEMEAARDTAVRRARAVGEGEGEDEG